MSSPATPGPPATPASAGADRHAGRWADPPAGSHAVALACGLTAVLLTAVEATGTAGPVRMPTTPAWAAAVCAAAASVLALASAGDRLHRGRTRLALGATACAGMLAGSLFAIPHTVILVVAWAGARVTGGTGSFDVVPAWLASAGHLANLAASLLLGRWLLRGWRARRGRCASCGRLDAVPPRSRHRHLLPWLAAAAVAASLPYGALKLAWGLGSRVGLTGHAFDDVTLASPGFGDTVVLTLVSVAACVAMGRAIEHRPVRRSCLVLGTIGSAMLLPVAVVGALLLVWAALTDQQVDSSEIAPWTFAAVYLSFAAWGAALAALTVVYRRATAPVCGRPFHDVRPSRAASAAAA